MVGKDAPMFGKHHSEEAKKKIGVASPERNRGEKVISQN